MNKNKYTVREFTVIKREDYNNMNINCKHYLATMYNDFSVLVNDKIYNNKKFNELYTENVL